jgi:CRP/FNR family cyclic AMP-dependent transcriptional regulator
MHQPPRNSPGVRVRLPTLVWDRVVEGAEVVNTEAGNLIFGNGSAPRAAAILAGVMRLFVRTAEGRQVTIQYARPGDIAGLVAVLGGGHGWNLEAVTDATLAMLDAGRLRALGIEDPRLGWAVAEHASASACVAVDCVTGFVGGSLTARVARHLLEAAQVNGNGETAVYITHERLADAVGTAREMVTRVLTGMRQRGLIETQQGRIVVLKRADIERLSRGDNGSSASTGQRR